MGAWVERGATENDNTREGKKSGKDLHKADLEPWEHKYDYNGNEAFLNTTNMFRQERTVFQRRVHLPEKDNQKK